MMHRKLLFVLSLFTVVSTSAQETDTVFINEFNRLSGEAAYYLNIDLDSMRMVIDETNVLVAKHPKTMQAGIALVIEGEYFNRVGNYDTAMIFFEKAHDKYLEVGEKKRAARANLRIAQTYEWLGETEKALAQHEKALAQMGELQDTLGIAFQYDNIAFIYNKLAQYNLALDRFLKAKTYYGFFNDTVSAANADNSIGLIYRGLGETEKEVNAFEQSYQALSLCSDSLALGLVSCNLGETYIRLDRREEGVKLLQDSERLFKKTNHEYGLLSTYNAFMEYYKSENPEKSIEYGLESVSLAKALNSNLHVAETKRLLGEIYAAIGQEEKALTALNTAYELAIEGDYLSVAAKSSGQLAALYEKQGQLAQSLKFFRLNTTHRDSLVNKENIEKQKEIELGHAFAQERLADSLQVVRETQQLELKHQQELDAEQQDQYAMGFVAILFAVISTFTFLAFRRKRKQTQLLDAKNKAIEEALHEKQLLLKEVHHRVKNNFQIVSSLLELQSKGIEDEKALALAAEGKNRVKSMALIHQRLYQNDDLQIHFKEYTQKLLDEIAMMYGKNPKEVVELKMQDVAFDIDTAIPLGLILNELVTNAFKYALKTDENRLQIAIQSDSEHAYKLVVQDNGDGIPENINIRKTRSLGLRLVRRLSEQLQGGLTYEQQNGACFQVVFKDAAGRALVE